MNEELISKLKIESKVDGPTKEVATEKINFRVVRIIEDKYNNNKKKKETRFFSEKPELTLNELIKKATGIRISKAKAKDDKNGKGAQSNIYVQYNNRLFQNGTIKDIGLTNNKTVYIVSPDEQKNTTQNEGFVLSFWSIPFLMIALSFLVAGLSGTFETTLRGGYVLISTLIGIPSFICLFIGLTERHSEATQTAFSGTKWFGCSQCSCNPCKSKKE